MDGTELKRALKRNPFKKRRYKRPGVSEFLLKASNLKSRKTGQEDVFRSVKFNKIHLNV